MQDAISISHQEASSSYFYAKHVFKPLYFLQLLDPWVGAALDT